MKGRRKGQHLWLITPPEVTTVGDTIGASKATKSSANFGLTTMCADAVQGTYMVRNQTGAQWLVAKGVDNEFDIIIRPQDRVAHEPPDERIIASVKGYIKRNER